VKSVARAAIVVACLSFLSLSCAKRSHGLIVAGIGLAGVIATGIAIKKCDEEGGCDSIILLAPVPVAVTLGGVLGAVTARSSTASVTLPPPEPLPPPTVGGDGSNPDINEPAGDDQAVRLTQQARAAAAGGECDRVRNLAPRVEVADAAYYRAVFLSDLAIVRCLNASSSSPGVDAAPSTPTPDAAPAPAPDASPLTVPRLRP
jgi:hypothetical protein